MQVKVFAFFFVDFSHKSKIISFWFVFILSVVKFHVDIMY